MITETIVSSIAFIGLIIIAYSLCNVVFFEALDPMNATLYTYLNGTSSYNATTTHAELIWTILENSITYTLVIIILAVSAFVYLAATRKERREVWI